MYYLSLRAEKYKISINFLFTVFPLSGGWVDDTKQFIVGHSFGIQINGRWFLALVFVGPVQGSPHFALADTSKSQHKDRVPDIQQLLQLNNL